MPYHLRYTPYELGTDLAPFCDKYDRFLIAHERHNKQGTPVEPHYHVYIESDFDMDTIRGDFLKKLSIPKCGRGKNNKYYCIKKWDNNLAYFVKQNNIIAKKGISEEELASASASAQAFRLSQEKGGILCPSPAPAPAKEKETEWIKILGNAITFYRENGKKEVPYEKWVKLIRYWYLKDAKPFPHPANTKRYAQSLDCLARSDWGEDLVKLEQEVSLIPMPD